MSVPFFWRCEDVNLDAMHDHSAGDTSAAATGTPAIDAAAARVGSNGILIDGATDQYRFDPASIWNRLTGALAFSIRFPTSLPAAGTALVTCIGNVSANNTINVQRVTTDELRFQVRDATAGAVNLDTTSVNLATASWFGIVARWDQPNNKRRIEVYDASNALIQAVEDLATAYTAPAELGSTTGFRIGGGDNTHIDNVFVADAYDEPLQNNLTITSWTEYAAGGAIVAPKLHLVRSALRFN